MTAFSPFPTRQDVDVDILRGRKLAIAAQLFHRFHDFYSAFCNCFIPIKVLN